MSTVVRPDRKFLQDVMDHGGDSVKKCFQCANCTAVCGLSSSDAPFPRKQMQLAGWGLKEKLAADPSVWFCHQCKDCSVHCPRNAKPADALGGIRLALIKHFAVPGFMGSIMSDPKYLPVAIAIPVVFMLVMLGVAGSFAFPQGPVHYSAWLPHIVLELMFSAAFFLGIGAAFAAGLRFWKTIDKAEPGDRSKGTGLVNAFIATFVELLTHTRFGKCEATKTFRIAHLLMFLGFAGLFVVTGLVVILAILDLYPLNITHPLKILGNAAALSLLTGCILAMANRLSASNTSGRGTYPDWLFLIVLLGVTITGITTQIFRFAEVSSLAYPSYFVHMVFNFMLLVFLPYSKFAHLVYRFLALAHARLTGRDLGTVGISEPETTEVKEDIPAAQAAAS